MRTLIVRELTIQHLLESSCSRFDKYRAMGFVGEEDITYAELKRQVDDLSRFLQGQGINHGDRVGILGENSPHWAIAYFAVTCIGAVAVPILPEFHTSEIHHILRHSEARALFVSERYYHKVEDLDFTSFAFVALLDTFSVIGTELAKATVRQLIAEGSRELRRIRNVARRLVGLTDTKVQPEDTAAIIYTSGTTGHSKGVMLSNRNICGNAAAGAIVQPLDTQDNLLSVLPLAHVYECTIGLMLPISQGASIYYLRKPPTAAVLLPALEAVRPTIILTVPLIIEKIFKTRVLPKIKERWLLRRLYAFPAMKKRIHHMAGKKLKALFGGRLRFFGIGGAALAPDVEQFLRDAEFPYAIGYGLTETSPLIAGSAPHETRFRAAGPEAPGAEIRIANPDPATGIGEIQARGVHIMKGYYRDEGRTREVFTQDGWFKTGDLGVFDKDGYLSIKGRLKNVIIGPSGENIYPEAVESVINRSPLVLESLVYDDGGSLVARVHLDYEKLDEQFAAEHLGDRQSHERIAQLLEAIRREANDQLSSFSRIARIIEQREPFEKTPTLKIKRYLYAASPPPR